MKEAHSYVLPKAFQKGCHMVGQFPQKHATNYILELLNNSNSLKGSVRHSFIRNV